MNSTETPRDTKSTRERNYKLPKERSKGPWDVIVVGSGMGGLSCAASLAQLGHKVLVVEQHYVPGGFTHTFQRKGFHFDVGVHCLGQMRKTELPGHLFSWLSDGKIEMVSTGPVYETFHFPGGETYEFPDKREAFEAMLKSAFPQEGRAIERYFQLIREVANGAKAFMGLKVLPAWSDIITRRWVKKSLSWWEKTTKSVLDELTNNEKLKAVLTAQWGYYGSTPSQSSFGIHAMVAKHYWNGGFYPAKGSQIIAETFTDTIRKAGGEVVVKTAVKEILFDGQRATGIELADGERIYAGSIVSAAGVKTTVEHMLPTSVKTSEWGRSLENLPQSPAFICLYLGLEGDIESAGASRSNQWFMNTWNMNDPGWDLTDPQSEAPVLYMSFPSLKDPYHPQGPGRHTAEVVTFVPWDVFEKWKHTRRGLREPSYMEFKRDIEDRLLHQLRKFAPKLMDLCIFHELSTPLSATHFTKAPQGAIYGLAATPERFSHPNLRARTPFKNFYLAGGDVATLGVTGALLGGVLAAACIDWKVLRHLQPPPRPR